MGIVPVAYYPADSSLNENNHWPGAARRSASFYYLLKTRTFIRHNILIHNIKEKLRIRCSYITTSGSERSCVCQTQCWCTGIPCISSIR